mgnify:CR=1 FL=1
MPNERGKSQNQPHMTNGIIADSIWSNMYLAMQKFIAARQAFFQNGFFFNIRRRCLLLGFNQWQQFLRPKLVDHSMCHCKLVFDADQGVHVRQEATSNNFAMSFRECKRSLEQFQKRINTGHHQSGTTILQRGYQEITMTELTNSAKLQ